MSLKKNQLVPFVFPDSGEEILVKRVSPLLALELQRDFPAPLPPTQIVMIGDQPSEESNPAHPQYIADMQEYQKKFEERLRIMIIKRGVEVELTEEQKKEVSDLREFYQTEYGKTLHGDDKVLWVSYIAIQSDKDMTDLINAILRNSQPTEVAVANATQSFQS